MLLPGLDVSPHKVLRVRHCLSVAADLYRFVRLSEALSLWGHLIQSLESTGKFRSNPLTEGPRT